jgi:adenine deaminase
LPLPIFGVMSDLPIETIADRLQEIQRLPKVLETLGLGELE